MRFCITMRVNESTNFKASYISSVQIKKLNPQTKLYTDCVANFLEIDSKKDMQALSKISEQWRAKYMMNIFEDIQVKFYNQEKRDVKFYLLTLQKDTFENLKPNSILGVAEVTNDFLQELYNLDYLQTKPLYKYRNGDKRKYKNIGTSIINEIKNLCNDNNRLTVISDDSAIKFYEKSGFVSEKLCPSIMTYEK